MRPDCYHGPGPKLPKELVRESRFLGPPRDSSIRGSGIQPRTTHAHRASLGIRWTPCRRTTVAGKEIFTAKSPRSQKRWAHSLLTSSPKGPKIYTPNWPAGKLLPFPDPGDHTNRHAEHLDGPGAQPPVLTGRGEDGPRVRGTASKPCPDSSEHLASTRLHSPRRRGVPRQLPECGAVTSRGPRFPHLYHGMVMTASSSPGNGEDCRGQ